MNYPTNLFEFDHSYNPTLSSSPSTELLAAPPLSISKEKDNNFNSLNFSENSKDFKYRSFNEMDEVDILSSFALPIILEDKNGFNIPECEYLLHPSSKSAFYVLENTISKGEKNMKNHLFKFSTASNLSFSLHDSVKQKYAQNRLNINNLEKNMKEDKCFIGSDNMKFPVVRNIIDVKNIKSKFIYHIIYFIYFHNLLFF
jgi:hypothetical protein